jgi:hypothetical protein
MPSDRVDVLEGDVLLPACGHQTAPEYARSLPAGGIQYRICWTGRA